LVGAVGEGDDEEEANNLTSEILGQPITSMPLRTERHPNICVPARRLTMKRFLSITVCLLASVPMMTNTADAAGRSAARPAAARTAAGRTAHASAARPGTVRPSASHAATNHTKMAHPQNSAGKTSHASQTNSGKNGGGQSQGRTFPGRGYRGFSNSAFLPNFGITTYFNPDDATWYYWYEPADSYLPVNYLNDYPPASNAARPNVPSPLDASLLQR
jgi:hypothetical protein